jgi:hypothetical protein
MYGKNMMESMILGKENHNGKEYDAGEIEYFHAAIRI